MVKNGSKSGSKSDPKMTLFRPPTGIDFSLMMVKMDPPGGLRPPGGIDFTSMMVKIDPREGRFWSFWGHLDP